MQPQLRQSLTVQATRVQAIEGEGSVKQDNTPSHCAFFMLAQVSGLSMLFLIVRFGLKQLLHCSPLNEHTISVDLSHTVDINISKQLREVGQCLLLPFTPTS